MAESPSKYRVQFDFVKEAYQDLNELQAKLQAPTKAEVVRYAIRTLMWVVSSLEDGKSILVDDAGNTKEVVFPFLQSPIARNKIRPASEREVCGSKVSEF